jgi:hypothetical protein
MKQLYKVQYKTWCLFMAACFCFTALHAQSIPANQNFSFFGINSSNGQTTRITSFDVLNYSVANAGIPTSGSFYSFFGNGGSSAATGGPFRDLNPSFIFNYGITGGAAYIPYAGQSILGDYRISFSQTSPGDTTKKSGNFQIKTMYLAIGAGNTSTVIIQGFRAGKVIAQATITGLSANDAFLNDPSTLDLNYSGSDAFAGLNISFGTNWQFLDGLRFTIPSGAGSGNIPLQVDDLVFDQATTTTPGLPATNATSLNVTGISANLSWSSTGTADYNTVFIKAANTGAATPVANADYTANTVFGSGSEAGTGWYCVYDGQGTSTSVSGLTAGTQYRMMVVAYNGNTLTKNYNTTQGSNLANFTTIAIPSQASAINVTNITGTTASLAWTVGGGTRRAVFVRLTNTGTAAPVFNTDYTASTNVNSGSQAGAGWRCVYNGTGTTVNITNLTAGQTYRAMVTEYNDNGLGSAYNTFNLNAATDNPFNFTMDNVPVVTSSAATSITPNGAILNGSIDDKGDNTTASFQYATNSGLASPSTVAGSPLTVTAGAGSTTITGTLSGLNPSTTYYYRIRGVNAVGPTNGSILNFITAPIVQLVSSSLANGSYKAGQLIPIQVVFTGAVTVTGSPTLALSTGGTATYASGSGSNTIVFNYTVAAGHTSADLNYSSTSALSLNSGTIRDANNNDASITLPPVAAVGSLAGQKALVVDTDAPTLSSVTIVSNNTNTSLAKAGDIVTLGFTSSETTITPTVTVAGHAISATNTSGNNWSVVYTMVSGDASGVISISIPFSDIAGNAGTTVVATTNSSSVSFDKTAPVLTPVTIASNNANTAFAKTGDVVTLNFTASEAINTPTITMAGHTVAAVNTSGNNWKGDYTLVSGDASGVISFNIPFRDPAGNNGTDVTATTNSSSVTFDKTAPSLSAVSIVSNNVNTSLVKTGEAVTLSFTSNETINTPVVTIAGHVITAVNTSSNNWTATYTMVTGDATGTVSFNISFSDPAANAGTNVTATTNSSSVAYDKTAPVLASVSIASNHTNTAYAKVGHVVTVSFISSEAIFTPVVSIHGNTASVTNTSGNNWAATYTMVSSDAAGTVLFNIAFNDIAGNTGTTITATTNSSSVLFDKTTPSLSSVSISSDNTNNGLAKTGQVITLNFTAGETITTPSVTIAGHSVSASNTSGNSWSAAYTMVSGDAGGNISFNISFSDLAGNAGTSVSASTNSSAVVYDKTNPSLTSVSIASNNSNTAYAKTGNVITVSFSSSESIRTPTVTILGNTATVSNTSGNNWTAVYSTVSGDAAGNIPFSISFSDLTGNAGITVTTTTNSSNVIFDKTAPLLTAVVLVSDNSNTALAKTGNMVTVNFTSDETISIPAVTIAGHSITAVNTGGNNWSAIYTMVSGDASGNVSFGISFSDLSGNAGTTVSTTTNSSSVTFDKTAPLLNTVSIVSDNANITLAKTGNTVTVNFTSGETINTPIVTIHGHTVAASNTGGNNWAASYTMVGSDASGNVSFSISFSDLSGNAGTTVSTTTNSSIVTFDKTAPLLTAVSIASDNVNPALARTANTITVSFTSNETVSTPTVAIAGHTATITNTGGNNWKAVYTLVTADASGNIPFSILFSDLAGNAGTAAVSTTNSTNVVYDKTGPSLTTVSILSNNADPSLAKPGDIVTLNFISAETIIVPSVTIAGNTAAVTTTGSNNWVANYTMTVGDVAGSIPFAVSCTDVAGNVSITVVTTTNSSSVTFDKTVPSVNSLVRLTPLAAVVNATSVIYRVSFSEPVKGTTPAAFVLTTSGATTGTIASVSVGSGTAIDVTVNGISGNGTLRLDLKNTGTGITDAAGNAISGGFTSGEIYTINQSVLSFPAGSTQTLTLCIDNSTPTSLNNMLRVAGGDNGQTLSLDNYCKSFTWNTQWFPGNSNYYGYNCNTNRIKLCCRKWLYRY